MENEEVFNQVDVEGDFEVGQSEEQNSQVEFQQEEFQQEEKEPEMVEPDFEFGQLSNSEKKDLILREGDEKNTFEIENAEIIKPRLVDDEGQKIEPKPFNENNPDKKGFTTKVRITYKDSSYMSLIPNVKWYQGVNPQTKKKVLNPWFNINVVESALNDQYTSEISKLYYKFCIKNGYTPGKLTQKQFIEKLPGSKVKLKQWSMKYKGETRYRIDVEKFV